MQHRLWDIYRSKLVEACSLQLCLFCFSSITNYDPTKTRPTKSITKQTRPEINKQTNKRSNKPRKEHNTGSYQQENRVKQTTTHYRQKPRRTTNQIDWTIFSSNRIGRLWAQGPGALKIQIKYTVSYHLATINLSMRQSKFESESKHRGPNFASRFPGVSSHWSTSWGVHSPALFLLVVVYAGPFCWLRLLGCFG